MRSLPISRLLREVTAAPKAQPSVLVSCFQIRRVPPVAQCRFSSSFTKQPRSIFISSTFCSTPYSSSFGIKSSKRSESTVAPPSTSSNALPRGASSQPIPPSSTLNTTQALTWNRFLHLRAIRRRFNLAASIITSLGTFVTGIAVLSQQDLEKLGSLLFGLDPILAVGLSAVGCGALGWLLGPFAGNAAFGLYYRRLGPDIAVKEQQFYQRIKRGRADPAGQSVSNPMPDYYGEKIASVSGYRQWLKDQRAFMRKRQDIKDL